MKIVLYPVSYSIRFDRTSTFGYRSTTITWHFLDFGTEWRTVSSTTLLQCTHSPFAFFAFVAEQGFDIWTSNFRQAYLPNQYSESSLFPKLQESLNCHQTSAWNIWSLSTGSATLVTLAEHHRKDLCMGSFRSDPALWKQTFDGIRGGWSDGYVQNVVRTWSNSFCEDAKNTHERLKRKRQSLAPSVDSNCTVTEADVCSIRTSIWQIGETSSRPNVCWGRLNANDI